MFDNAAVAQDVLKILQATLPTMEIIKMKDRIFELNAHSCNELNPLAHYVACLIEEREYNNTLAPRPFIVEWKQDDEYIVHEECKDDNMFERCKHWREKLPYADIDILHLTRP
jgi:hypothetical protein